MYLCPFKHESNTVNTTRVKERVKVPAALFPGQRTEIVYINGRKEYKTTFHPLFLKDHIQVYSRYFFPLFVNYGPLSCKLCCWDIYLLNYEIIIPVNLRSFVLLTLLPDLYPLFNRIKIPVKLHSFFVASLLPVCLPVTRMTANKRN